MRGVNDAKVRVEHVPGDPHNPVIGGRHDRDPIPLAPWDLPVHEQVLQLAMPCRNPHTVARAARVLPGAEGLSIAGLNGWGQADDRRRSRAAGFDAHFVKPVGLAELAAWLAAVQRRGDR